MGAGLEEGVGQGEFRRVMSPFMREGGGFFPLAELSLIG